MKVDPTTLTGTWTLDPARSSVKLKTKAIFGLVPVKGTFTDVSGTVVVDQAGGVTGHLEVDASSLDTKMKKRDTHLRSADFFDVENHPVMSLDVTSVEGETMHGTITVKTSTAPVTAPLAVVSAEGDTIELDTEFTVDRSELGLDFTKQGATKMANTLTVHAVLSRS